jgi:lipid II:glycine glycyltransferase (peptidoglycan interpeptide bridge formation enzyme)
MEFTKMIDVVYKKKFLKVNQIWYPNKTTISELLKQKRKADILFVHGVPVEETKGAFRSSSQYHTCISNLDEAKEELLNRVGKKVRYQIRRSEKDPVEIKYYTKKELESDRGLLEGFAQIYEKMYISKGMDTKFNMKSVEKYLAKDCIIFSAVLYNGEVIIFHSYICDGGETRFLHSASCFRESDDQAMIGRANKRLQWEDLMYFKSHGYTKYDWGGISDFDKPNGIDEFKLSFGGDKLTYYNVFVGNTLLGKLAVTAMNIAKR